ncbi:MAG: anhydro-N-acetylmuramic acid kinase [Pirellulales bacterium]
MPDSSLLHRLCARAEHRRWLLGVTASARYGSLSVALVATLGSGADSRVEVVAHRRARVPGDLRKALRKLRAGHGHSSVDAAILAAQLAERQALLLDEFAADVAPIWNRVSAVSVHGPGIWRHQQGLIGYAGLCDAARLADLSGLNVIDGFPNRDLAQDGRGRPLLLLPLWMLLHDARKPRAVVDWGRCVRLVNLPASRDASAAARSTSQRIAPQTELGETLPVAIARTIREQSPPVAEAILCGRPLDNESFDSLRSQLAAIRLLPIEELGVEARALKPAAVALLGHLHLDQAPASVAAATGARTPRVLGRLTPGSVVNWHRLVRELAARRPNVVTLRSAI